MIRESSLAAFLLLLTSAAAAAQTAATPAPVAEEEQEDGKGTITVMGKRYSKSEARKVATEMVRNVGFYADGGQYARWNTPVCIKVVGIAPYYGAVVTKRIEETVKLAGAKLDRHGCAPNLIVAFSSDSKALANELYRNAPARFLAVTRQQDKRALLDSELPVRWVYYTSSGGADDRTKTNGSDTLSAITVANSGGEAINLGGAEGTTRRSPSLIDSNLIIDLVGAVVLVDLKRAEGYPLESVANYVARVGLSQTRMPPQSGEAPSILDLFRAPADTSRIAELSRWDEVYLRSLYRMIPNREGWKQRNRIQADMVHELATSAGSEKGR